MASETLSDSPKLYFVWGGIFIDREFRSLEAGSEECYGPFHDVAQADRIWKEKAQRNIDIAQHRLFVLTVPQPVGA